MKQPDLEVKVRLSGQYQCVLNEGTDREVRRDPIAEPYPISLIPSQR